MSLSLPARALPSLFVIAALFVAAILPAAASANVQPLRADLEAGDLSEFSQWHDQGGTLNTDTARAYSGARSGRAHYPGGVENAYQRGIWNLDWDEGETVWYSAAIYLPVGFHRNMRGQVDILRWDNWEHHPNSTDWGGLVIWNSDKRMRLMRFNQAGDGETLVGPFEMPEGRWVHLEVHQKLSGQNGAGVSEVYMDGRLLGSSTRRNMYSRSIDRLRVGVVAIGPPQTEPLTVWFDRVAVDTRRVGPLGGAVQSVVQPPKEPTTETPPCSCQTTPTQPLTAGPRPVAGPASAAPTPTAQEPGVAKPSAERTTARRKYCRRVVLRREKVVFSSGGRRVVRYRTRRVVIRTRLTLKLRRSAKCRRRF